MISYHSAYYKQISCHNLMADGGKMAVTFSPNEKMIINLSF